MTIKEVAEELRTQDNRATYHPMFCVQILVRDCGYDRAYVDGNKCWWSSHFSEWIYKDPPEDERELWEGPFGYIDRWETVMTSLTRKGCERYLELDGHNVEHRAFRGNVRIYADSFYRNEEMITVREHIMQIGAK